MTSEMIRPMVSTIRERCRVCYTCVRECPAKAIRISEGQAEVIGERCIGCGNCFLVCSQKAKKILDSLDDVRRLLASGKPVAACLAPSFPVEFNGLDEKRVVGAMRALGFAVVAEVAFGADLVATRYRKLLAGTGDEVTPSIATTCPAVVRFVEQFHPDLVGSLSPIVSPMLAEARVLHAIHGQELKIVFIGPCIAKKAEAGSSRVRGEVDAVLTFAELRELMNDHGVDTALASPSDFDPPHGGAGALFPISRGMLQAAEVEEDLLVGQVVSAQGRAGFVEAIGEFASGHLDARLLEVLCCDGCIMGPGITRAFRPYRRRALVASYARRRMAAMDMAQWHADIERFANLDLSRSHLPRDQRIQDPSLAEIASILARMGKSTPGDELNCGACGYQTCREHAIAIFEGLAESEMCLPYTIDRLRRAVDDLAVANDRLASTQEALVHSEKLASMGQLAAGIAHEVNNPLGVVLMYTHLLLEDAIPDARLRSDLEMIVEQADRCKKIVSGLLNFARQQKVDRRSVRLPELTEHVLGSMQVPDGVRVAVTCNMGDEIAHIDPDQITQVILNLANNAIDAMPSGGTLDILLGGDDDLVTLAIRDTGVGIPRESLGKIFEPFYTTKAIGKGTGLGLAVTYGIVKMHSGDITVESNADPMRGQTGTTVRISIPRRDPYSPKDASSEGDGVACGG